MFEHCQRVIIFLAQFYQRCPKEVLQVSFLQAATQAAIEDYAELYYKAVCLKMGMHKTHRAHDRSGSASWKSDCMLSWKRRLILWTVVVKTKSSLSWHAASNRNQRRVCWWRIQCVITCCPLILARGGDLIYNFHTIIMISNGSWGSLCKYVLVQL